MKIFVYGTLKRGHHNNDFLSGQKYLGEHYTKNDYTLFVAGLPFLVKTPGTGCRGEVWDVSKECLAMIDRLEGHPAWYKRERIFVYDDNDDMVEAQAYLYPNVFNETYPYPFRITRDY